jgi:hypothetical protein
MIDPTMICLEFLPSQASKDLGLEVDQESQDGRDFIATTVAYEHLSELALRMYQAGWLLNDIEGNLAHVKVNKRTGEESPARPMLMVIFAEMDDSSRQKIEPIDPSLN